MYIAALIFSGIVAFLLGWTLARRKNLKDTIIATKVISNLKAAIQVWKIGNEMLKEENKILRERKK